MFRNALLMYPADEGQGGGAPAAAAPAPVPAPAAPALADDQKRLVENAEAFKRRLDEASEAAQKKMLKDLGFSDAKSLQEMLAKAKQLEQEKMTEKERLEAKVKELEPSAKRAEAAEAAVKRYLEAEEAQIPADKKGLLVLAPASENPQARLDWLVQAKAQGLFAVPAPATPAAPAPKPANPVTTMGPPGPSPAPAPGTQTHQQQYDALMRAGNTFAAAALAQLSPDIKRGHPDQRRS